ncbi:long-chain-fatty-acyl-CoA reductase [Mycobacterium sp. Y57]|uniref:acyl-CoA reductase n=1 Tax=Mycolicibacterium xanthum TaxID=2796469 RepID=UPI001C860422|nr:acyl-CoA reductase [Mycolicibacterium xanthum]MBX7432214.1 long-chain-fatty-acyl-CoA reductase [Mycolicibacterium xanthum]
MINPVAHAVIRGEVVDSDLIEYPGRAGGLTFMAPDPRKFVDRLPLASPGDMADLYDLSFDDILDYLEELGKRLDINSNEHMQQARELTYDVAPVPRELVDLGYSGFTTFFERDKVRQVAEKSVGLDYLEGWVEHRLIDGVIIKVRAFGSRGVHIVAGNGPGLGLLTLLRSAISRSDCIIKAPSNDPFTSAALGKTMCEMAPDHPLTKHFAVAYWQGGDAAVEEKLFQPHNVEKIIAWGGFAGIKHVTKYIQPGLELISLDPKTSISVVGPEALDDEQQMKEAASRLAIDIGGANQAGCASSRVTYVLTGSHQDGVERMTELAKHTYDAIMELPSTFSVMPKSYDKELKSHVDALRLDDDWYEVIGGERGEGAMIVSKLPRKVDFAAYLADRTANFVPCETIDDVLLGIDAYTQTIGVWPESLKAQLQDVVPFYGAQRLVTLGNALYNGPLIGLAHDGMEPVRRMCKWIANEVSEGITDTSPLS